MGDSPRKIKTHVYSKHVFFPRPRMFLRGGLPAPKCREPRKRRLPARALAAAPAETVKRERKEERMRRRRRRSQDDVGGGYDRGAIL